MPWRESLQPVRMARIAVAAPAESLRDVLVAVADEGTVELDRVDEPTPGPAARRLQRVAGTGVPPALCPTRPDLDELERAGRHDLLGGEAQLEEHAAGAITRGGVSALAGWVPAPRLADLASRLAGVGGAVVPLPHPRGVDAPSLLRGSGLRRSLTPLVRGYGAVPYVDVDPTPLAWVAYVVMFGMMFGDTGHGALLVAAAAALRAGRPRRLARFRDAWPFVAGAGLTSAVFGLLYGEFFGPTGVVPVLWLRPLQRPVVLLLAAVGVGAVLLAGAYLLGIVNRRREGGWPLALYAASGIAGAAVFVGGGLAVLGWYLGLTPLVVLGGVVAAAGLVLAFAGFAVEAGGGGAGISQASVEVFGFVTRLGTNIVSFARLAAFGLTHAAVGAVVWSGTTALWHRGGGFPVLAPLVFVAGNALAFSLAALVAAVQALRLEYYELFSRVFQGQGRPFRPWHVPVAGQTGPGGPAEDKEKGVSCLPG